jgi:hypothetical protein
MPLTRRCLAHQPYRLSRAAPHGERAVLAILRAKAPRRALDLRESNQVAEWQATALLELAGLSEPPTPASLIAQLPRVIVQSDSQGLD